MYATGSGVVVVDQFHVLTNLHVVAGGDHFEVALTSPSGPSRIAVAELVYFDPLRDLAMLRLVSPLGTPIEIAHSVPAIGSTLIVAGYPGIGGQSLTVTRGSVSGIEDRSDGLGAAWLKTDAVVSHGNSGGAALNSVGQLVGVLTFVRSDSLAVIGFALGAPQLETAIQTGLTRTIEVRAPADRR